MIFILGIFLLINLSFFRYDIGWDYHAYIKIISNTFGNKDYNRIEPINKLIAGIAIALNSIPIFFGIYSIASLSFIYLFIKRNSNDKIFSLFLFYTFNFGFISSLSTIRSFLAISILCFGTEYIYKKELKKYFFLVLIASLIHTSALIGIVFYYLYEVRLKWYHYILIFGISLKMQELILMTPIFSKYYIYFNLSESSKYMKYIMILYSILTITLVSYLKNKKLNFLNTMIFIGGIIGYNFNKNPGLNRISNYFLIYLIIYIPILIGRIKQPRIKLKLKILVMLITSLMFFYMLEVNYRSTQRGRIIPYKIFIGEKIRIR
ncbi:MAG: EpsG family protein [Cetobacterium sp.]